MTSRYRVEYALKSHRRDQLIECNASLHPSFNLFDSCSCSSNGKRDEKKEKVRRRGRLWDAVEYLENGNTFHYTGQRDQDHDDQQRYRTNYAYFTFGTYTLTPLLTILLLAFSDCTLSGIKGLLAVPFVLHSQPDANIGDDSVVEEMATNARRRYAEIMRDVEILVNDHIAQQAAGYPDRSKLKLLVPSVGIFFTPLLLQDAFIAQDMKRAISSRRFVSPSFNDVRLILNTAQVMSLVRGGPLRLVTFDGDVTLYDDGASLIPSNIVIPRILEIMQRGICVGIVTAAGYTEAKRYNERLHGLLEAVKASTLPDAYKRNLIVLGGESNFMFRFDPECEYLLDPVDREEWALDEMRTWTENDITELLDLAEASLRMSAKSMRLKADILRKDRAVGIVPQSGTRFFREQLEETVLAAQKTLDFSDVGKRLPFCAFNGGNDVFVDIGDKKLGVSCCQRFFGDIKGLNTLHVGDQFLSVSGNDFKTRMVCTTCWVASPAETVDLLDEFIELLEK